MKTAIIITTYNRPQETKTCFDSIMRAKILPGTYIIIVDDKSTDPAMSALFASLHVPGCQTMVLVNPRNSSVSFSLKIGYTMAWALGCEVAMNLDADCLVNNLFQQRLLELHLLYKENIVTGFNCYTRNKDGSERHKVVAEAINHTLRNSVGGINMVINHAQYIKWMEPALNDALANTGNWDHKTCLNSMADGQHIVTSKPSVVQHQATKSSMGHMEEPDTATDFKPLSLPKVTLVCVDDNHKSAFSAVVKSREFITFAATKVLTSSFNNPNYIGDDIVKILPLGSKEAYSAFIINDLYKYITTDFALIVQHDGYVKNWSAWTDEFLQYDYIGAAWHPSYSPYDVGNGGFSLRSLKLLKMTAAANWEVTHPEDAMICREHAEELKAQGIKFAPREVADKFSFEGYNQYGGWNGQFGFHGERALKILSAPQYTGANTRQFVNMQKKQGLVFNQFLGLGDIIFLVPMARHYMSLGHDIVWPVADEYQPDLKRHFPDIQFVLKSGWVMDYERRDVYDLRWTYGVYKVLPLRWNICRVPDCSDCMTGKYTAMGLDWKMWRGLKWEGEVKKCELTLIKWREIDAGARIYFDDRGNYKTEHPEYELHCNDFGCEVSTNKKETRDVGTSGLPVIRLRTMKGFSMLDWSLVIENATIIHAVSSSTLYMFETLNLKAKEIHLYGRNQGMKDHVFVQALRTKDYILHP